MQREWRSSNTLRSDQRFRLLSITAFMLMILVVVSTIIPAIVYTTWKVRVDPDLMSVLGGKDRGTAYIVASKPIEGSQKIWKFGDVYISKKEITYDGILQLMKDKDVISIWGASKFKAYDPLAVIEKGLGFEAKVNVYDLFTEYGDIKLRYHRAPPYSVWCGRGVVVAVIDTGIDYMHPDFYDGNQTIIDVLVSTIYLVNGTKPIIWIPGVNGTLEELYAKEISMYNNGVEPWFLDVNGHGTHVSGIIAGRGVASNGMIHGIAPCSRLVVIKAFNMQGYASLDWVLTALEWVYNYSKEYNISIVNISWGIAKASDGLDPLSIACDKLVVDKGVFVVVAAGNNGNYPTTINIPGVARYVVTVGAMNPYTNKLAPFSSIGTTVDYRMKPDVVGAGVYILAPKSRYNYIAEMVPEWLLNKYYMYMSGTSMATPCVVGVIADFIEMYRTTYGKPPAYKDLIRYLEENSKHISPIKDFITGWGIPLAPP